MQRRIGRAFSAPFGSVARGRVWLEQERCCTGDAITAAALRYEPREFPKRTGRIGWAHHVKVRLSATYTGVRTCHSSTSFKGSGGRFKQHLCLQHSLRKLLEKTSKFVLFHGRSISLRSARTEQKCLRSFVRLLSLDPILQVDCARRLQWTANEHLQLGSFWQVR